MKTNLFSATALTIFMVLVVSSVVGAQNTATTRDDVDRVKQQIIKQCAAIDVYATKIQSQQSERSSKLQSNRVQISGKISERQLGHEAKLTAARTDWDAKRQENFDKLRKNANNDEQKQAVEEYVLAVHDAITTRRAANDVAFAIFREELLSIKAEINQSFNISLSENASKIQEAITQAKTACQSGQDPSTTKQQFKSAISSVQQSTKQLRKSSKDIIKSQLKVAIQKRKDTVKANNDAFKASLEEARQKLLANFGEDKTSIQ